MKYAIYQTGSSVLPFINNPKDVDIVIVAMDAKKHEEELEQIKQRYSYADVGVCDYKHFKMVRANWGLYPYLMLLESNTIEIEIPNIWEHKKEFLDLAVRYYNHNYQQPTKLHYRYLLGLFLLKNGSKDLTADQISQLSFAHDNFTYSNDFLKQAILDLGGEIIC